MTPLRISLLALFGLLSSCAAAPRGRTRLPELPWPGTGWTPPAVREEGGSTHRESPNHLSVLLAGTSNDEGTAPTIGLDYEYRVDDFTGLGAVVEYAGDELDAWT